ncbi:MAG: ribonuclease H-like domain-containing protein [bacterium]|nr:ribonuclease H-like domain-containing protein [bacterium]
MVKPHGPGQQRNSGGARDKLRRAFQAEQSRRSAEALDGVAERAQPASEAPTRGDVRAFLRQRRARLAAGRDPDVRGAVELPAGEVVLSRHGPLWRRELRYPLTHRHGDLALGAALQLDGERLAELAKEPAFAAVDPRRCLFLDTETTGLSGGAGTVVFNVGFAYFRGEEFIVEQLFLRDFGEEEAMLRHVAGRLWQFPVPVSFVGKSYDRHRIATRMALHKLRSPVLTAPHLDLYYLARRAFGAELPDTRLRTVEELRLGVHRADDLPGSEAPAAFFDWIRDHTGPVDRVLEHNRLDVLSLCTLLARLAGRI